MGLENNPVINLFFVSLWDAFSPSTLSSLVSDRLLDFPTLIPIAQRRRDHHHRDHHAPHTF